MQRDDDAQQTASGAVHGLGAGLIALLAALGRQADDVARVASRQADDLARGALHQSDDIGRAVSHGGDELLGQADDVTPHWALPEAETTGQTGVVQAAVAAPVADDGAEAIWRHLAHETAEIAVESAVDPEEDAEE